MTSGVPSSVNSLFDVRRSGVLLHPTCLPGPHGCGDLGAEAHHFVDWLHTWLGQNLGVRAGVLELRAYDKDETAF